MKVNSLVVDFQRPNNQKGEPADQETHSDECHCFCCFYLLRNSFSLKEIRQVTGNSDDGEPSGAVPRQGREFPENFARSSCGTS